MGKWRNIMLIFGIEYVYFKIDIMKKTLIVYNMKYR